MSGSVRRAWPRIEAFGRQVHDEVGARTESRSADQSPSNKACGRMIIGQGVLLRKPMRPGKRLPLIPGEPARTDP